MNVLDLFGEIAAQKNRLESQNLEPIILRGSTGTLTEFFALVIPHNIKIDIPSRFMDLEVSIDNGLPFGVVRVLGAWK